MTTSYADLPAAMLGRIRATPSLVAAFGEDAAATVTTKFWADFAPSGVLLPWACYEEFDGEIQYMTPAGGKVSSIETGQIRWTIVGEGRKAVRDLGKQLVAVMNDAPLVFADGRLMDFRARKPFFIPVGDLSPGSPAASARVVIFDVMVERSSLP